MVVICFVSHLESVLKSGAHVSQKLSEVEAHLGGV